MANTQIKVSVLSDMSKFDLSKVSKDLKDIETTAGKTNLNKLSKGFKDLALPAGIAFGAITAGAMSFAKSAEEAEANQAKLNQVFSSMGYAENAQAASNYASELSKIIGVDDDVIKGAQTKLATFSEVAKSTETMGRATTIAADLAAAGFGSMDSASVMLGKALQDPIKGVGALSRVGVTFTEDEKKMIEQMVKTGDTAGAQAKIMEALETQVGGVAEASATGSDKMSTAFGEVGEAIGTLLLPLFESLSEKLTAFADWAQNNTGLITAIAGVVAVLAGAVLLVNGAMAAWTAITTIWTAVTTIATAVGTAFGAVMAFITSPIFLVVAAIVAVIAVIVLLYKNWDEVSAFLKETWQKIKDFAVNLWNGLKEWFSNTWNSIKDNAIAAFKALKEGVSNTVETLVEFLKGLPKRILDLYAGFYTWLFQKGVDLITGMLNGIKNMWTTAREWLSDIPQKAVAALSGIGSALFNKGQDLVQGLIDGIKSIGGRVKDALLNLIPGPLRATVGGLIRSADLASMTMSIPGMETRGFESNSIGGYVYTTTGYTAAKPTQINVNYNIEVSSMVADRNAGQTIVNAIKQYERSAGGSWRK